jgi:hypothetical protein
MTTTLNRRLFLALAPAWAAAPALALDAPKGKVVLSITGRIGKPNAGDRVDFDMEQLAALPQQSFTTATPWFKQPMKFTGPLLRDVLAAAGANGGTTLTAVALNKYKVDIPAEDARLHRMVLARLLDDKPMSVREKGPLFIVYPFDDDRALQSERYYNRSAWQLRTLEVK